jgi:hypothetical protein
VAGYNTNLQKSLYFLHTNNEETKKKYMETIPFTIALQKMKYLAGNLTKDVNDIHKEKYIPLKKEMEEEYTRWRNLPCS